MIFWTNFAKTQLNSIFNHYKEKSNLQYAKKLVEEIVIKGNFLDFQSKIGEKEELLKDLNKDFRYLIFKEFKIIYFYNQQKNRLEIVDVFEAKSET